jgi:hypothetical protein
MFYLYFATFNEFKCFIHTYTGRQAHSAIHTYKYTRTHTHTNTHIYTCVGSVEQIFINIRNYALSVHKHVLYIYIYLYINTCSRRLGKRTLTRSKFRPAMYECTFYTINTTNSVGQFFFPRKRSKNHVRSMNIHSRTLKFCTFCTLFLSILLFVFFSAL